MNSFRKTTETMRRSMDLLNENFDIESQQFTQDENEDWRDRQSDNYQETNTDILQQIQREISALKNDFSQFKRKHEEQQTEILSLLKKMKRTQEAEHFDIGNSPHTDAINKILSRYYIQLGRFVKETAAKKQHLERLFYLSPTGLSQDDLMERVKVFEKKRFSYWRTEERRRVIALSGWEALLTSTTRQLTKKLIHLLGQKGNAVLEETLFKDLVLVRYYIKEIGLDEARKDTTFWLSYGRWRVDRFPCSSEAEWRELIDQDRRIYQ